MTKQKPDRDDQIEFARDIKDTVQMARALLAQILDKIDLYQKYNEVDKDILDSINTIYDGADYVRDCLENNLKDASINSYKTTDDELLEELNKREEALYNNTKRSISNENKL